MSNETSDSPFRPGIVKARPVWTNSLVVERFLCHARQYNDRPRRTGRFVDNVSCAVKRRKKSYGTCQSR